MTPMVLQMILNLVNIAYFAVFFLAIDRLMDMRKKRIVQILAFICFFIVWDLPVYSRNLP